MPDHRSERRRHPRRRCEIAVEIDGIAGPLHARTRDVSLGGVFLFAPDPPPRLDRVKLGLRAAGEKLDLRGEVVHRLAGIGFGVRFLGLSAGDREVLAAFLGRCGPPVPTVPPEHVAPARQPAA